MLEAMWIDEKEGCLAGSGEGERVALVELADSEEVEVLDDREKGFAPALD